MGSLLFKPPQPLNFFIKQDLLPSHFSSVSPFNIVTLATSGGVMSKPQDYLLAFLPISLWPSHIQNLPSSHSSSPQMLIVLALTLSLTSLNQMNLMQIPLQCESMKLTKLCALLGVDKKHTPQKDLVLVVCFLKQCSETGLLTNEWIMRTWT